MNTSTMPCPACSAPYEEIDVNCNGCNYPLQGNEQEKDHFTSEREVKQIELSELSDKVNSARKSLFIIAGLDAIFAIIMYLSSKNEAEKLTNLISEAVIVTIFFVLGIWAKKKTKTALITGLIIFVTLHLLNALFDPMSLLSGIIFKIIIIAYLIKGIKATSQSDKLKKELNIT